METSGDPKTKEIVRTRFAPSPTGFLQLGNVRTALFAYLFAKENEGIYILRIEDTDQERSKTEYEIDIIQTLKWLGLDWNEGPDIGGAYGPYRQSEKLDIYERYLQRLLQESKAFYCFCPEEELETQRQYQLSQGQPAVYSGKCRSLSPAEAEEKIQRGEKAIIRFKNIENETVIFEDMIRGKTEFDPHLIGDYSIARSLRSPLYNFSCVIDDFDMKITHVVRGEDHISNTPKQILLQRALGFPTPKYAHLPMILAPDHSKLSKRHGAVPASDYAKEGYLAETIINFLVLLGWHPEDNREIFSLKQLEKEFSLKRVQKSGAIFNQERLDWLSGFYLRNLSLENLTEKCLPYLMSAGLIRTVIDSGPAQLIEMPVEKQWQGKRYDVLATNETIEFDYLVKIISLYQQRLKKLSEISELVDFFLKGKIDYPKDLLRWKEMTDKDITKFLEIAEREIEKIKEEDWQKENLEQIILSEAEKAGDRGCLLWPLRVALTGKQASAGPLEIAVILGKEKTLQRIKDAKSILKDE
ncbi:MAG: glutamate--tRNA ligase [bacterium]|nr:glutamate--tRNA ligase [bacterium]